MPDTSPNLALPYLLPAQAQKHVTHNEALARLDLLVQLVVAGFDALTPPASPAAGDIHALGAVPLGDWAGQGGRLAVWDGAAWGFITPRTGWRAWGLTEGALRIWRGTAWESLPFDNLDGLGVGTAHDATNRLAVAAPATLLTHAGAGHQVKVNKAAVADTASLLFQSNWAGRAEMGLAGNDDFSIKVSPDGSSFQTALRLDRSTGLASGTAVTQSASDATAGRLMKAGDFGLGGTVVSLANGTNLATAGLAGGLYSFSGAGVTGGPEALAFRYVLQVGSGLDGRRHFLCWRDASTNLVGYLWLGHQATNGTGAITWHRVLTASTLLGSVSQSGGAPTGAVIERGSNANGDYVRFADGTQICTRTVSHDLAAAAFQYWSFAANFVTRPVGCGGADASFSAQIGGWYARQGSVWATSSTQWATRSPAGSAVAETISLQLMAIGRWF